MIAFPFLQVVRGVQINTWDVTLGHWTDHLRGINHKKWKAGLLILVTINGLLERHFLQTNKSILEWVKCDLLRNIFPDPNSQWTSKPI